MTCSKLSKTRKTITPAKFRALRTRQTSGNTVFETAIAMTFVVIVVIVLLGGLTGKMNSTFDQTVSAFRSGPSGSVAVAAKSSAPVENSVPEPEPEETKLSHILLRFAVFAAVVFALMSYTVVVVSRSEKAGQLTYQEREREERYTQSTKESLAELLLDRRSQIGRAMRNTEADLNTAKMTVETFMTRNPITSKITDEMEDVETLMTKRGFRHMMIVDTNEKLVGIISDRDLVGTSGKTIAEVMTPQPFSVEASSPVNIAITMLVKNRISALPVVENDLVVGILTRSDLLVTLQCLMLNIQERLAEN